MIIKEQIVGCDNCGAKLDESDLDIVNYNRKIFCYKQCLEEYRENEVTK